MEPPQSQSQSQSLARLPAVFTAAQARRAGVRADRLPASDVTKLARGVYTRLDDFESGPGATRSYGARTFLRRGAHQPDSTPLSEHPDVAWRRSQIERALLLSDVLPTGGFFCHHTAAAVWNLPVPARPTPALDLGYLSPARGSRKRDFLAHHFVAGSVGVTSHQGAPLTDPATTWVLLAAGLPRRAAVALGDAVIHTPRFPGTTRLKRAPLGTLQEIQRLVERPHRRGRARLSMLMGLLSEGAASPPESHLRLLLHDWGMPPPELDYDVCDSQGRLLGCSELAFPGARLALEYEGDHHRVDARQWNRDIEKYRAYTENGWEVLRVTAELLYRHPEKLRAQIAEALARRKAQ